MEMHIGKRHTNPDLSKEGKVDAWKDINIKDLGGNAIMVDEYIGKEVIRKKKEKKTYYSEQWKE